MSVPAASSPSDEPTPQWMRQREHWQTCLVQLQTYTRSERPAWTALQAAADLAARLHARMAPLPRSVWNERHVMAFLDEMGTECPAWCKVSKDDASDETEPSPWMNAVTAALAHDRLNDAVATVNAAKTMCRSAIAALDRYRDVDRAHAHLGEIIGHMMAE